MLIQCQLESGKFREGLVKRQRVACPLERGVLPYRYARSIGHASCFQLTPTAGTSRYVTGSKAKSMDGRASNVMQGDFWIQRVGALFFVALAWLKAALSPVALFARWSGDRQADGKCTALSDTAVDMKFSIMEIDKLSYEIEADTGPLDAGGILGPEEPLTDPRKIFVVHTNPVVPDGDRDISAASHGDHVDGRRVGRIFDGVGEKIGQDLIQRTAVSLDPLRKIVHMDTDQMIGREFLLTRNDHPERDRRCRSVRS